MLKQTVLVCLLFFKAVDFIYKQSILGKGNMAALHFVAFFFFFSFLFFFFFKFLPEYLPKWHKNVHLLTKSNQCHRRHPCSHPVAYDSKQFSQHVLISSGTSLQNISSETVKTRVFGRYFLLEISLETLVYVKMPKWDVRFGKALLGLGESLRSMGY